MSYLSIGFAVFVVILFGVYQIVTPKLRWKLLLVASVFFYLSFDVRYVLFLLFVALSTFFAAKQIAHKRTEKKKKKILFVTIVWNVLLWFAIKVLPWCGNIVNSLVTIFVDGAWIEWPAFIVPVGISYYSLMAISYLVDVYKGKVEKEDNFFKYLLYLTYFPTIVQGPISRYDKVSKQLSAGTKIDFERFRQNMLLILTGLIKKMVIADRVAIFANYCFKNFETLEGPILYVGAVCYSIQLYMDFSGCVDICRGVSALFGIDLIDNFNAPYFARSIKEFWAKWHISLSGWLKDYIYIPLGGNRKGQKRKYVNLIATFFVSGIWHGAGINFMFWGLLHGVFQMMGDLTTSHRKKIKAKLQIKEGSVSEKVYQTVITFNLVTFAWIFFRSTRFLGGVEYIGNMMCFSGIGQLFDGSIFITGFSFVQCVVVLLNIVLITVMDYFRSKKGKDLKEGILNSHILVRWVIYFILIYDVILFGVYGQGYDMSGFLYGGF